MRRLARDLRYAPTVRIEDGQELTVEGHIEVGAWSELPLVLLGISATLRQLVAYNVTLVQSAPTRETLQALKVRAEAQGWLDAKRKRPLPHPPQVIGLITGESSRAYRDVTGSLRDAGIKAQVIGQHVLLSGPDVACQTRSALASLNARPEVDVIVIAQGGSHHGRDLTSFNDWELAEAIVHSRAPVLTAIGHRQDQSLADAVADESVPTPSRLGQALALKSLPEQHALIVVLVVVAVAILLLLAARALGWM